MKKGVNNKRRIKIKQKIDYIITNIVNTNMNTNNNHVKYGDYY